MIPTSYGTNRVDDGNREIAKFERESPPGNSTTANLANEVFAKYPLNSTLTKLSSTLEIKQNWLYNEWAPECQFSKYIRPNFPNRMDLAPENQKPNTDLIQSTFHDVRGKWALWQSQREEARWKKIEAPNLKLDWIIQNVEVLYPSKEQFEVSELKGIVLWRDKKSNNNKRYQLYEGNHRVSAWLAAQTPSSLPAIIFVGKPAKQQ